MNKKNWQSMTAVAVILLAAVAGRAQEEGPKVLPEVSGSLVEYSNAGWHPRLKFNGNFSLADSRNVPGNTSGLSVQLGTLLNGTADYLSKNENHEWTNFLLWELGFSRTPVVKDVWIKSMDTLEFKTAYLYHFPKLHWMGPFVSFRMTTTLLPAYEVRGERVSEIRLADGETAVADANGNPVNGQGQPIAVVNHGPGAKIELTDSFAPLTLRESVGFFAKPFANPAFLLDSRLGVGAWETSVRGGYFVDDDDTTPWLELRELQNSRQFGAELEVVASGVLKGDLINYKVRALLMQPFAYSPSITDENGKKQEGIKLLNREFEATLGVTVTKYLSINYSFKAMKQPLIINDWQVQNSLLISVGFDLVGNPPPAIEEPSCDCAAEVDAALARESANAPAPAAEQSEPLAEPAAVAPDDSASESAEIAEPAADATPEATPATDEAPAAAVE